MKLTQTILSKLKACQHSARRCAERATLGLRRQVFSTLKGLNPFGSQNRIAPLQGAGKIVWAFTQGSAPAQPWAELLQPYRLPKLARIARTTRN